MCERKRLLARTRIIDAARELMTNGHIEDVTIQDITSDGRQIAGRIAGRV